MSENQTEFAFGTIRYDIDGTDDACAILEYQFDEQVWEEKHVRKSDIGGPFARHLGTKEIGWWPTQPEVCLAHPNELPRFATLAEAKTEYHRLISRRIARYAKLVANYSQHMLKDQGNYPINQWNNMDV